MAITPEMLARAGTEHAEQCALFCWLTTAEARERVRFPRLFFAIPNGGARDMVTAARLKAEGVKAGVPDICYPSPAGRYHGLWLELKRAKAGAGQTGRSAAKGRASAFQNDWGAELAAQGYAHCVAYGWIEARAAILAYEAMRDQR